HAGGRVPIMKKLSCATERYDATARPLRCMIMHFEALLQTTVDIMRERNPASFENRGANLALEVLTVESMIQLGMVADADAILVRCFPVP
ncbi:MAG: hypothetical protein ACKPKO_59230, partial [Candidatus Fonsibacter sp.]